MEDFKDKQIVQRVIDNSLSGIQDDPWMAQRVLNMAHKAPATGGIVVNKKLSIGVIFVIVMILTTITAIAATIVFAKRVPATAAADRAMLQTYGITAQMQSLFTRTSTEGDNGTTIVTYEGRENLAFVLGKYTVVVDGQTVSSISWSRDGEDTSGGLEASAWGKEQLKEILRIDPATGRPADLRTFQPYIDRINQQYNFDYEEACEDSATENYVVVLQGDDFQKAKESQLFTTQEFVQIAKKAVCERYHLTAQQASSITIDVDENSAYVMLDGTLCYRCWIFVGEFSSENTEQEGTYTVYVNLETGVVEDIMFLSEQGGGNG